MTINNMKNIQDYILQEAKSDKKILVYYNYSKNSIAIHITDEDDKDGFKTIDEAVKEIWSKYPDYNINIVRSDKFITHMNK